MKRGLKEMILGRCGEEGGNHQLLAGGTVLLYAAVDKLTALLPVHLDRQHYVEERRRGIPADDEARRRRRERPRRRGGGVGQGRGEHVRTRPAPCKSFTILNS